MRELEAQSDQELVSYDNSQVLNKHSAMRKY